MALAGGYIEALGRTDLIAWTPAEFAALVEVIVTAYTNALRDLMDHDREVEAPPW